MDDGNDLMASYDRWGEIEDFWMIVRKHDFAVMQYTGVKTIDGKEV